MPSEHGQNLLQMLFYMDLGENMLYNILNSIILFKEGKEVPMDGDS